MSVLGEPRFQAWVAAARTGSAFGGNLTVVDKVPPDMLPLVDHHWYQYPPLNPMWHSILGLVIVIFGLLGFCGNAMVIYIFSCTKSLRTPSNLFVVNLAFSDFLMMTALCPMMAINCYYETWVLGAFMCELHGMLGSLFGCTSIWTMTMIAMDRYNVIVKGLSGKPLTHKGALLRIVFVYLFSLIWTLAPMFGWNRYVPEGNMTACGTDYLNQEWLSRSYIIVYSVFVYFLPLFGIVYSYFFIVQAVAAHEKAMREQAKKMNVASLRSSEAAQTSAECKLAKVALMTIALWFVAWTPYLVTNYIGMFSSELITPLLSIWCSLCAKGNACCNPIVYGISHPKYKQVLHKKFPRLSCADSPDDSASVASGATQATGVEENKV
uniref:Long wavelength sensitive opsin n=1 Tax=Protaetia brevitarsis TaxID=348688 RepID=A0A8F2PFZ0_PROBE|nr:long wavelength sensitive opsin [Protaetia brevitarsis]